MNMHAFTDGLVALTGLVGFFLLFRAPNPKSSRLAGLALGLFGVAATIGTVKFLFGWHALLKPWHSGATQFAMTVGMGSLGLAFLGLSWKRSVEALPIVLVFGALSGLYLLLTLVSVPGPMMRIIPGLAVIAGTISGFFLAFKGEPIRGIACAMLAIALMLIGLLPPILLSENTSFHVFHTGSAMIFLGFLWLFAAHPPLSAQDDVL